MDIQHGFRLVGSFCALALAGEAVEALTANQVFVLNSYYPVHI